MAPESTFATKALRFYTSLRTPQYLPKGVEVMNPYRQKAVREYTRCFLAKYFSDNNPRVLVFGINPGRFGAGITGITFTDPVALEKTCGIANELPPKHEPSSLFIYEFIARWGGPEKFYRSFFLSAISPLGFTRDGRNYNFYDDPRLLSSIWPFLVKSIQGHLKLGVHRHCAIVLGTGKLKSVVEKLNAEHGFFRSIEFLEHPRFIRQYRWKSRDLYLAKYRDAFARALQTAH